VKMFEFRRKKIRTPGLDKNYLANLLAATNATHPGSVQQTKFIWPMLALRASLAIVSMVNPRREFNRAFFGQFRRGDHKCSH